MTTTTPSSPARSQFLVIMSSRLASAAVQALVGIGLARSLVPSDYGQITSYAGVVLFWFIVCDLGIASYTPRARALGHAGAVSTAMLVNTATAALGAVLAIALTVLGPFELAFASAFVLIVVGQALDKNVEAALGIPIADGERLFPAVSVLLRRVATAVVFFGLLLAGTDAVWAYCVGMAVGPLVGQVHVRRRLRQLGVRSRPEVPVASVLGRSSLFAVNDVAVQSRSLDAAVVALTTSTAEAGLFSGAAKLLAPFELASSTLAVVVLPRAARSGLAAVRRGTGLLLLAAVLLLLVLAPVAWFASPLVTVLVLGEQYRDAAPLLATLVTGLPFMALASPLSAMLQGLGRERFVAVAGSTFAVLTLGAVTAGAVVAGASGAVVGVVVAAALKAVVLAARILTVRPTQS